MRINVSGICGSVELETMVLSMKLPDAVAAIETWTW